MIIKGTDRIKGVVDLSSIGLQLGKTSTFTISENDFWKSDVQAALRMGYIQAIEAPKKRQETPVDEDQLVRCINKYPGTINVSILDKEIGPKMSFVLKQSQLNHPDIRAAIGRGMIQILNVVDPEEQKEGFLKMSKAFKEKESVKVAEKQKEADDFKRKMGIIPEEQEDTQLETNEEIGSPTTIIDTENPDPVKAEIDDSMKVIWNPSKSPLTGKISKEKITKHVIDDPDPSPVLNNDDPKGTSVIVNPNKTKVTNTMKTASVWPGKKKSKPKKKEEEDEIIAFINEQEEEEKRIEEHPVLKEKKVKLPQENDPLIDMDKDRIDSHPILGKKEKPNDEIDFVTENDEERIKSHPILGKKYAQNEELDI